jgi:hypothetical protein
MSRLMIIRSLLATVLLVSGTGCLSFSDRGFRPVTREISRQAPQMELRKEFAVSIGAGIINTLDLLAVGSEFDFSEVDKVQVAVYEIPHEVEFPEFDVAESLGARDPSLSWEIVVQARDEEERTWVLMGIDHQRQTVEAVSIMVLQRGELVLIHVDGGLQEMIEFAFRPARDRRGGINFS